MSCLEYKYDLVEGVASEDPRIGSSHLKIFFNGYRGYAGAYFPKDIKPLLQLGKRKNINVDFLKIMNNINENLISKQKDKGIIK